MQIRKFSFKPDKVGFVLGAVFLVTLTGCIGYVDRPRAGTVYVEPPSVYVEGGVVVQDDYVYYPGYQVYYSNNRHQYMYLEGRSWVTRPAPPHVSAEVLLASPSVRLDFHDAPSFHHATVVRQYPKHWAPPGPPKGQRESQKNDQRDGRKGNNGR